MKIVLLLLVAMVLPACGSLGGYGQMNEAQINAAVKDKSSVIICTEVAGPWGKGTSTIVNIDKTVGTGGGETSVKCGETVVDFKDAGRAQAISTTKEKAP